MSRPSSRSLFARQGFRSAPRGERIIAALDIGSSKVACLVARVTPGRQPEIIGFGHKLAIGIEHGAITNMEAAERSLRSVIDQAEQSSEHEIDTVVVNFAALGIDARTHRSAVQMGGYQVEDGDIDFLHRTARDQIDPEGRAVLHAHPVLYTIDGARPLIDPRCFQADELALDVLVVSAPTRPLRDLDHSLRQAQLRNCTITASPIATGRAALADDERAAGVALVELGAGITTVSIYARNRLLGFNVLQVGSAQVAQNLAFDLQTRHGHAERLLSRYGSLHTTSADAYDMVDIQPITQHEDGGMHQVPRTLISQSVRDHTQTLLELVEQELEGMGFWQSGGRQVVLTGGFAGLAGLAPFAETIFQGDRRSAMVRKIGVKVRIGTPVTLPGLPERFYGPGFSTVVGLVLNAADPPPCIWAVSPAQRARADSGPLRKMISILRERL